MKAEEYLKSVDSYYIAQNSEKERVVISYESAIKVIKELQSQLKERDDKVKGLEQTIKLLNPEYHRISKPIN